MTFNEAVALQPTWVNIWVNILFLGAFITPFSLFIWRETRMLALITLLASFLAAFGIFALYAQVGYVKLLGLPHLILWIPLLVYHTRQLRRPDLSAWPRRILLFIMTVIAISLVFDIYDVLSYLLGNRTPFPGTAP